MSDETEKIAKSKLVDNRRIYSAWSAIIFLYAKRLVNTEFKKTLLICIAFSTPLLFVEHIISNYTPPDFNQLEIITGTISIEPRNRVGWVFIVDNGTQKKHLTCAGAIENSNCNLGGILDEHVNKIVTVYYYKGTVYQVNKNEKIIIPYKDYIAHYQYEIERYPYIFTVVDGILLVLFVYLQIFKDPLFFLNDPLKKYENKE